MFFTIHRTSSDRLEKAVEYLLVGSQIDFPVLRDGKVLGLLTRGALIDSLGKQGLQATLSSIPIRTVEAIDHDLPLDLAYDRIQSQGVRCLPVLRSGDPAAQDFGAGGAGRNGIEVRMVDGVSIENLTACNFLGGATGENGNQIWWNGGDGSGRIGMGSYRGAYLTASTTWFDAAVPHAAQYGIFASNARGPGLIERSYASNMADSSFYVGACADCNAVLRRLRRVEGHERHRMI